MERTIILLGVGVAVAVLLGLWITAGLFAFVIAQRLAFQAGYSRGADVVIDAFAEGAAAAAEEETQLYDELAERAARQ